MTKICSSVRLCIQVSVYPQIYSQLACQMYTKLRRLIHWDIATQQRLQLQNRACKNEPFIEKKSIYDHICQPRLVATVIS